MKIESQRLQYLRFHQSTLRAEQYDQLQEWASNTHEGRGVGRRMILPGSFVGGPRDMFSRYLDAMALVRAYGKPDLFITVTCNPKWKVS